MAKAKESQQINLVNVRNIGIAAHVDAGKTTLTERVLYYTGANHKIGEVHDGNAHMDWQPEEQAHGITITSAVTQCPWKDHLIQIVDTPGHVDFTIEVERSMRVLDGAIIVMDGVRGVEPQTETVWRQANKNDVPRFVFVNKMDRPGADFDRSLQSISERLKDEAVPVCIPDVDERVVLHLIEEQAYMFSGDRGEVVETRPLTEHEAEVVAEYRESLCLSLAERDEALEEKVLMEEPISADEIWAALKTQTLAGYVRPAFSGSALKNWGVQPMLDAVLKILPNPLERPDSVGRDLKTGEEVLIEMTPDEPLCALVFKVQLFDGRRHCFARIYRGKLEPGDEVALGGRDQKERVARVFGVNSNKKTRINGASAGMIVLLAGLRRATTGDTLCTPGEELILESIDTREPVLGLAIEPESAKDEDKLIEVLGKITEEDPTLKFEEDPETGQRVLKGMGELHLQIAFERMAREFKLNVRVGKVRVVNRETVGATANGTGSIDRVIDAGANTVELKASVSVNVEPLDRGAGLEVVSEPSWSPAGYEPSEEQAAAVAQGARDALSGGPVEGSELQDVKVTVSSVETFGPGSSAQALRIAAATAVREAMQAAGGLLMQPIMKVEVVVPEEDTGRVLGDLQSKGATILGHMSQGDMASIDAECGLAQLIGYATELRSNTKGRGQFVMEFNRFDVL